jgi:hypothetical protein
VRRAFPEAANHLVASDGAVQTVEAQVLDRTLQDALGKKTISLFFNQPGWKTAAFGGPRVEILLKGRYMPVGNKERETTAPLMVRFRHKKGTVIFTSFHNEAQNSDDEKKLLQYLVFSLELETVETEVESVFEIEKEGKKIQNPTKTPDLNQEFKVQRSTLLNNADNPSFTSTYDNQRVCTLRFTLAFRADAKLTFKIKSPDGKEFANDVHSTTSFDVPDAAKGTWTYTVIADPSNASFPFNVSVREKK